jgi:hypothetical protein
MTEKLNIEVGQFEKQVQLVRKCSRCGEIKGIEKMLNYHSYCKDCYSKYQSGYYKDKVRNGEYIYILWNIDGEPLYIGSTNNKYRLVKHLKGNSHLGFKPKDWHKLGLLNCTYVRVNDIILDKQERLFLEGLYVRLHQPQFNSEDLETIEIDPDREEELNYYFERQYTTFKNIDIDRKRLQLGEVEVSLFR